MPAECRPATAAVAAAVIGFTIVLALRAIRRTAVAGAVPDANAPLLGPRVRAWYRGLLAPCEAALVRSGVSADTLTYLQLVVSVLAGLAFAEACTFLGGWLTILAGTLDILDGGVARRGNGATLRGAFIDSIADRWAEFATFAGLAALFREGWMLFVVALAAFGSFMVSYTRARAEGIGLTASVGLAPRMERLVLIVVGIGLAGIGLGIALIGALAVIALLSVATTVQRIWHVRRVTNVPTRENQHGG